MKKLVVLVGLLMPCFLMAQTKDYKVVFDLTSKDSLDQKAVMRWINEISKSTPTAKLEVVMYAKGLELALKNKSIVEKEVAGFATNSNVKFKVCEIAMKNQNIDKSQLIDGVEMVPDGIYEIISKQHQGWGYIKATH
ncbi:DsrE family protein [Solitalea sp. MAHUQ-68]|uniref:DsrE family protein n=1 Tax=Solitalea agri TaxID=2953739 RepID=A0A9X2F176_9SPHI|nr:DsrE family protein [Solitalea agri]MCO4292802.1 DsrE family protein [Solitalea agri]